MDCWTCFITRCDTVLEFCAPMICLLHFHLPVSYLPSEKLVGTAIGVESGKRVSVWNGLHCKEVWAHIHNAIVLLLSSLLFPKYRTKWFELFVVLDEYFVESAEIAFKALFPFCFFGAINTGWFHREISERDIIHFARYFFSHPTTRIDIETQS